jgi:hypothetical protein
MPFNEDYNYDQLNHTTIIFSDGMTSLVMMQTWPGFQSEMDRNSSRPGG